MKYCRGFTLVEVLVVISLLALLATLVPFVNSQITRRAQLISSSRIIIGRLRAIKMEAYTGGKAVSVAVDQLSVGLPSTIGVTDPATGRRIERLTFYSDHSATAATINVFEGRRHILLAINPLLSSISERDD